MKHTIIILAALLFSVPLLADDSWQFKSNWDIFSVVKNGANYSLDGVTVSNEPLENVKKLFQQDVAYECSTLPKRPDLTITLKTAKGESERKFYLTGKIMSDGKGCIEITGLGIYYLPYHRQWFTGAESLKLALKQQLTLKSKDQVWVDLAEANKTWTSKEVDRLINWEMLFKFRSAIKEFPITGRAHPNILNDLNNEKDNTHVTLFTSNKSYEFYKIKVATWLLKLPSGTPWLLLSDNFGIFDDMTRVSWDSENAKELNVLINPRASTSERIFIIDKFKNNSSRDVRMAFYHVLQHPEGDAKVKISVIQVLRKFPSDKTMAELVKAMDKSADFDVLAAITDALRVRNPKGPKIDIEDSKPSLDSKIATWKAWAKTLAVPEE